MVIPCNFPESSTCASSNRGPITNTRRSSAPYDISFIVGPEGDTWTIPGRKDAILRNCEALAVLLLDGTTTIRVNDVNKQGFEHFLRHIEGSEVKFTSVQTARTTLDVAFKYQCISLVKICLTYLDLNLDVNNVLIVYKNLSKYCNNAHRQHEPCAPEYNASTPNQSTTTVINMCSALLHNCLLVIDANANDVLTQDLETLDFRDMSTIVNREHLQINELILFDCIMRWLRCECMRTGKPVNAITRKEILGDLIYKVRYGLLSRDEFMQGPGKSGIFTPNEINEILVVIDQPTNLGDRDLLRYANDKRVKGNMEPKYLSSRTEPHLNNLKNKKKKHKKDKSKALINCLTVWVTLFD